MPKPENAPKESQAVRNGRKRDADHVGGPCSEVRKRGKKSEGGDSNLAARICAALRVHGEIECGRIDRRASCIDRRAPIRVLLIICVSVLKNNTKQSAMSGRVRAAAQPW
jgi:hypothetical protein